MLSIANKAESVVRQNKMETHIFISHASEDKASFARPLAKELESRGLKVWFDETSIYVGDSLRGAIDRGLATCDFGVVILSPVFFQRRWTQLELDALVSLEASRGQCILPVWHEITYEELYQNSPLLASRVGVSSSLGVAKVADYLIRAMYRSPSYDNTLLQSFGRISGRYYDLRIPCLGVFWPYFNNYYAVTHYTGWSNSKARPDAEPYVKPGDIVKPGTVICSIDGLGGIPEVETPVGGVFVKYLLEPGDPVEYYQPVARIRVD